MTCFWVGCCSCSGLILSRLSTRWWMIKMIKAVGRAKTTGGLDPNSSDKGLPLNHTLSSSSPRWGCALGIPWKKCPKVWVKFWVLDFRQNLDITLNTEHTVTRLIAFQYFPQIFRIPQNKGLANMGNILEHLLISPSNERAGLKAPSPWQATWGGRIY